MFSGMLNYKSRGEDMALVMNNLKLYRKKSGYTQEQIAEKLGVSRQAVAKWENGDSLPDIENVIALADLYEVTVDYLVRNINEPIKPSEDKDKHIFGFTKLNDKGQITLPKNCREVFGLHAGDAILVLGDEKKGIALVKMGEIFGK